MHIEGVPEYKIGSFQDTIRNAVWYRREQRQITEAMLGIYAVMMPHSPEIAKKIEPIIDGYIDLIIPGSVEWKKKNEANTVKANANALSKIYEKLSGGRELPLGKGE